MNRVVRALVQGAVLSFVSALGLSAQTLADLCPNSGENMGVLVGQVSDPDAEMVLPGATATATWRHDGSDARTQVQTGLDGSFVLCYLPLETEVSVQVAFATMPGQTSMVTLTDPVTRQDLLFSMSGGAGSGAGSGGEGDDRIMACIGSPTSTATMQMSRLVRCEPTWKPLEQCPKEELGIVTASATSRGRGAFREMLETLIAQAQRLGANALVNLSGGRGELRAEAVRIDIDPATC